MLEKYIKEYLNFCEFQKRVSPKTLKAYRVDLEQFARDNGFILKKELHGKELEEYIQKLHQKYKPKTVKRKIASIRAFYHYLEYREIIKTNPFHKLQIRFKEPQILPRTIPLSIVESLLAFLYLKKAEIKYGYAKQKITRDIAIIELLFSTGIRISELCSLKYKDVNLYENILLIYGKGGKERRIQLVNEAVLSAIKEYKEVYKSLIEQEGFFFVNKFGHRLSEQSVRVMINNYSDEASIDLHITPHMFRHTFATCLLEADVDIRFIQELLGHSSITITEIYTHVATAKQKDILALKHPRQILLNNKNI